MAAPEAERLGTLLSGYEDIVNSHNKGEYVRDQDFIDVQGEALKYTKRYI